MYLILKRMTVVYALLMFALTVIIGISLGSRIVTAFIRGFGVFFLYRYVGLFLVYLFFFSDDNPDVN